VSRSVRGGQGSGEEVLGDFALRARARDAAPNG
jgi:hypothetical protein